jgi:hypothetical protein
MADKQKGWDMERVALLQKIKSISPRREWRSLSEEERHRLWRKLGEGEGIAEYAEAIEAALKEKNQ